MVYKQNGTSGQGLLEAMMDQYAYTASFKVSHVEC